MGLVSDNPLVPRLNYLNYNINVDMLIGYSKWDGISGLIYINVIVTMHVDVFTQIPSMSELITYKIIRLLNYCVPFKAPCFMLI